MDMLVQSPHLLHGGVGSASNSRKPNRGKFTWKFSVVYVECDTHSTGKPADKSGNVGTAQPPDATNSCCGFGREVSAHPLTHCQAYLVLNRATRLVPPRMDVRFLP